MPERLLINRILQLIKTIFLISFRSLHKRPPGQSCVPGLPAHIPGAAVFPGKGLGCHLEGWQVLEPTFA